MMSGRHVQELENNVNEIIEKYMKTLAERTNHHMG